MEAFSNLNNCIKTVYQDVANYVKGGRIMVGTEGVELLRGRCNGLLAEINRFAAHIPQSYLGTAIQLSRLGAIKESALMSLIMGVQMLETLAKMANNMYMALTSEQLNKAIYDFYNFLNSGETIFQKLERFNAAMAELKFKIENFTEQSCKIAKKINDGYKDARLWLTDFAHITGRFVYGLGKFTNFFAGDNNYELNNRKLEQFKKNCDRTYDIRRRTQTEPGFSCDYHLEKMYDYTQDQNIEIKTPAESVLMAKTDAIEALSFDLFCKEKPALYHVCVAKFKDGSHRICAWIGDDINKPQAMVEFEYDKNNKFIDDTICLTKTVATSNELCAIINKINNIFCAKDVNKNTKELYRKFFYDNIIKIEVPNKYDNNDDEVKKLICTESNSALFCRKNESSVYSAPIFYLTPKGVLKELQ
ncbi:MAG: hypothetical protein IJT14_03750 [Rickettsiales bacterium]|nr:hypothetical protein [Rickettsiales bacterium]